MPEAADPRTHETRPIDAADDGTRARSATSSPRRLVPGQTFGTRYRILKPLGAGGMGAVYQAWDDELGVAVALKIIRTDTATESDSVQAERRFKRELLLTRQVTHRNVVRIHDLGDVDGIKYLTMPCIDGEDLGKVLAREGRLPVDKVLSIGRQVAAGLGAAHEAGVVHRDLKPENVMLDGDGRAIVMDFGIARSAAPDATATLAGSVVGTLEYMAPEQVRGEAVDQRADIYAFGLLLRDLLTGRSRVAAHPSAMAELVQRVAAGPPRLAQTAPHVPAHLAAIVERCTKTAAVERYQSIAEVLRDLERLGSDGRLPARQARQAMAWRWRYAAVIAALLAVAAVLWWALPRPRPPATTAQTHQPVSVLIADFRNEAGDPVFDGLLEQALGVGIEGASFVSNYPRRDAVRVAGQLRPGGRLDDEAATLIALREGIKRVVCGSIARRGTGYHLSARLVDPNGPRTLLPLEIDAKGKDDVLAAVGSLATGIRRALGDTQANEKAGPDETFTAGSLEAAHAYARGQELHWAGKYEEADAEYRRAIALDPDLGRAYAGLGAAAANLGRQQEAERYYKEALARIDRMTEREKLRTRGGYYLFARDADRARDEFQLLVKEFPADSAGLSNLALAEFYRRDMTRALELNRQGLALMPNNMLRRGNTALTAMYAGDCTTAEAEAKHLLESIRRNKDALLAIALCEMAADRPADAERRYREIDGAAAPLSWIAAAGLSDVAMYEGRLTDADRVLASGLAGERDPSRIARLLVTQAEVALLQGNRRQAAELAERALASSSEPAIALLAARVLIPAGRAPRALALTTALSQQLAAEYRHYALLIEAQEALESRNPDRAIQKLQAGLQIADSWLARFDLARAYVERGAFAEADSELDRCLRRRGEASAVLLDDVPTYRLTALVPYYQGRVQEGLKSAGAIDAYKRFLAIKQNGDEQGLVADARRRVEGR